MPCGMISRYLVLANAQTSKLNETDLSLYILWYRVSLHRIHHCNKSILVNLLRLRCLKDKSSTFLFPVQDMIMNEWNVCLPDFIFVLMI